MSQSNLIAIPIDESILFPMESLDQHLADSSKSNQIISPILKNLLLQYGDQSSFELLNYSESLSQELAKMPEENTTLGVLSQEQIALPQDNILPLENIVLPLGIPPFHYKVDDVALKGERQEIAFIKRSSAQKRTIEKSQSTANDTNEIHQEIQSKVSKKIKTSTDKITKKIATEQNQIKEPVSSTCIVQDTEQNTVSLRKKKSKKRSKRKEISEDHDKEPNQKQAKKDSFDKKLEQTKSIKGDGIQKTSLSKKEKSSKNRNSKKGLTVKFKESIEPLGKIKENTSETKVDLKEGTLKTPKKKLLKRRSNNDNLSKSEEETLTSNSSPAKQSRGSKVDLTDPIYLEPFKYGWKREVVYRALKDKKTLSKLADTYYITPEGKKFRALKEMSEILSKCDHLTEDNFTYNRKPLGVNDPTKEIVRNSRAITTVSKERVSSRKSNPKSQKSSNQNKDIQENNNISLHNLEQNSDSIISEKGENTSESGSQLQKESDFNKPNSPGDAVEDSTKLIISASRDDTIAAKCDNSVKEINSTETLKEVTQLDNNNLDNKETLNQKMLPNIVELNPIISRFNRDQDDNEIKKELDVERNSKDVNSSITTSTIDHTIENSEIDTIKSIYLVDHLGKEIRNSSYNILEEIDSDTEDELSDIEENLNQYVNDLTESEYKSTSISEKNLEDLNSSFSEKIFITESVMINSQNIGSDDNEKKCSLKVIDKENLISEKMSQSNFDHLKHIKSEVEISKDSDSSKDPVLEGSSTSSDDLKVSATDEEINSFKKTDFANLGIENTLQSNLDRIRNIGNELELLNDLNSEKVSVLENSTTADTSIPLYLAIEACEKKLF